MTENNIAMIDNQMHKNYYTLNAEISQDLQNSSDFNLNNVTQNEMIIQIDECEVIMKSFIFFFYYINCFTYYFYNIKYFICFNFIYSNNIIDFNIFIFNLKNQIYKIG